MSLKERLFSFEGRMRRRDWWLTNIGLGVLNYIVTQVIAPLALGTDGRVQITAGSIMPTYPFPLLVVLMVMAALMFWPYLALSVKRTHDRDQSARINVILITINTALSWSGILMMSLTGAMTLFWVSMASGVVIGLYLLVVLGFLDGTPGPNRFGPSPKGLGGLASTTADTFT